MIFIIFVAIIILLLSFISNYIFVWLLGISRIYTVTAIISILYVVVTVGASFLSRSVYAIAPLAVRISGILLGLGYYLFVCSVIGIFVYWILVSINQAPSKRLYGFVLIALAVIATIAGFIYAQMITVRYYTVKLSDNFTKTQNIALISDTHFGPARNTKLAERFVSKLSELSPDMILYAGDMYDGPAFDFNSVNPALIKLTKIAPVYFSPGNHEGYGSYSDFMSNNNSVGFKNLVDETATQSGITILGIGYRLKNQSEEVDLLLGSMKSKSPELFNQPIIAIHHSPIMLDMLSKNGVDISVHSHTHRGQFWPNSLITRMVYGKYHYGLNLYNEMNVITTSGVGTAGPAMRLFNTPEIIIIKVQY